MEANLFGVPLLLWGTLSLVLAIVWCFVWPKDKAAAVGRTRYAILRWGHTLVWLFLALAAFLTALDIVGGASTARLVAFLGLITYLAFMFTLRTS